MSRTPKGKGHAGSLKWLQTLVNDKPDVLASQLDEATSLGPVSWRSPLAGDDYAEYSDRDFLGLLGTDLDDRPLEDFWPRGGPEWDALGVGGRGDLLLVEAKAHVPELFSNGMQAEAQSSIDLIERSLGEVRDYLGAKPNTPWTGPLYQYCNRLAHLYLLRVANGLPAWLVNCYFTGDDEMGGPRSAEEWQAALQVVKRLLGLGRHRLQRYVIDLYIPVEELEE